jgi:hypothetical protein
MASAGAFARIHADMPGILLIVCWVNAMPYPSVAQAAARFFSVTPPAGGNIVPMHVISIIVMERWFAMEHDRFARDIRYLAAMAVVRGMFQRGLIDEHDYSALETKFAALFLPLIRYEKPSLHAVIPVTLTVEGRAFHEPDYTENTAINSKGT